ncbi:MAG TPA: PorT family protein [Bacteroidales bacterium]|nr:PorT family protein [Bacteroidales bacterium]
MKKIILMIVSVIFMANISNAQDNISDSRSKLNYGIKAGLNLSNVYDTQSEDYNADPKIGFVTGVFVAIPIGKFLGFHPEILFSQKGYQASGTYLGFMDYEFTRTSNFIDLPLLIAFKPTEMVTIVAGPQYSYLIKQKDEITSGDFTDQQVEDFENDNLRRNTLCFLGGIDFNFNHIVLGARAGWDIQNNNGDGTSTDPRYKNVWYQATIGFRF